MFIIARRSKSNLGSFNCIHTRIRTCSSLQGDRSPILAHFIAYILVYVHVHHCKAIEVKFWLILLDTYSYVNVHHCKAIEVKSWLILLQTYSYVNVHHCKAIEVKSWLILLDTYSYVNVHHCKAIEVKSWLILLDTYSYYVNVHHCNYIVHYFNIIWVHVDSNYH